MIQKFKKRPVTVEAVLWNGSNSEDINGFVPLSVFSFDEGNLVINTLEGKMTAQKGDWIIKGVKGEFYPCKPDIFEATYEAL
ncbi:hypothetical protein M0R04_13190 [Candidatus Dojkabacteria bacterium]|jgi:hypothetical protein|nr:hypothetical protein [Candidatus Dojkabacteria bacterium]